MNPFKTDNPVRTLLTLLVLAAATFAVYWRIVGHEFLWGWDDNVYITENEVIRGISWNHVRQAFTRFYAGNYCPVQMLSYMLDYQLWGLSARGFLGTNIAIHLANGMLLWLLSLRWTGSRLAALAAAALFLLHPVQVESVAWASQRKTLLAMFFLLLSWEEYDRYRNPETARKGLAYFASLAAFVLSLLAKSVTVFFPVALLAYDACFPAAGDKLRWQDKIPFVAAGAIVTTIAMVSVNPEYGGATKAFHGGSPLATFYTMLPVFCQYLAMIVWPANLSAEYSPFIHTTLDAGVAGAAALLAATVCAGIWLSRKDRRLGFWFIFFWLALLPMAQIVPLASMINDRYLYLPFMGVALLFGCGAASLQARLGLRFSPLLYALLAVILMILAAASHERTEVWRNSMTLFSDAVKHVPDSTKSWDNLVTVYKRHYDELASSGGGGRRGAPPFELDLGAGYASLAEPEKDHLLLVQLLKIYPGNPVGWSRLGDNRLESRDLRAAAAAYQRAHDIQPKAMHVVIQMGNLAVIQRQFDVARTYYLEVESKGWNSPEIAYQIACVESLAGRREEALHWLEKALQRGYRDYGNLLNNEELAATRNDPRFTAIIRQYFSAE